MTEKNLLRESNKTTPYVGKEPQRRRSGFFDDDDDDARRTTRPTSSSAAEKVRVVFLYDDDFCAFFSTSVFPLFFSPLDITRLWFVFSHSFSLSRTTTTTYTTRDGTITGIVSGERVRAKAGKNASEGGNDPV